MIETLIILGILIILILLYKRFIMKSRLYIIGNGFDIHHGIRSKYSNFRDYVQNQDNDLYEMLEKYFDTDELWSDFEETLAHIDTDTITQDATDFLVSYGADNWSDAYHHDYQHEIQQALDLVTVKLRTHFTNWILELEIPDSPNANIKTGSIFINFNYTDTLECAYGISPKKIFYIHNKAIDNDSVLILGHSRDFGDDDSFSKNNDEDTDTRVAQGNDLLDNYFKETYKDTETIIRENISFFNSLKSINEVFVLGHSISPVDIKYFQLIKEKISKNTDWTISYYQDAEKQDKAQILKNLGIDSSKITLKKISEL